MTETITTLNKKSGLNPYRKIEIKRRLSDGSGAYETNWHEITDKILSFDTVVWKLDTETVGVFSQSTLTLTGNNTNKEWDDIKGMFKDKPNHDFTAHAADEYRGAAIAEPEMRNEPERSPFTGNDKQAFFANTTPAVTVKDGRVSQEDMMRQPEVADWRYE